MLTRKLQNLHYILSLKHVISEYVGDLGIDGRILKLILKKLGVRRWTRHQVQDRFQWRTVVNIVSIRGGKFLRHLSGC